MVSMHALSCGGEEPVPAAEERAEAVSIAEAVTENLPMDEIDIYAEAEPVRIGYVRQDHHAAVFVAALRSEMMHEQYPVYLIPMGENFYALIKDNSKIAEIELIETPGAINVPNNMQAGLFDIGFGGVVPFASSVDQGNDIRIISPLHQRGDMLVLAVNNDAVSDWRSFTEWVRASDTPVTIGYKSPQAVALIIFQSALQEAGLSWAMTGAGSSDADVLLYNAQGEPNLNPALQEGLIDGYVSNNPACAMAEYNGIGKCVCELSLLPPGDFENHPCCAIAATEQIIADDPEGVSAVLELFAYATDYMNNNPEDAAAVTSQWLGTPVEVEQISMATSMYDMHVTDDWTDNLGTIMAHMRSLNAFTGPLSEARENDTDMLTDFSMLPDQYR